MSDDRPRVIGLDLGLTQTGVVWRGGNGRPVGHSIAVKMSAGAGARERVERIVYIAQRVVDLVNTSGAETVAIEGYAYGTSQRLADLGELGGAVRFELWRLAGKIPLVIPPNVTRLIALGLGGKGGGRGGPKKPAVMKAVRREAPGLATDDERDAYVVMRCAELALAPGTREKWTPPTLAALARLQAANGIEAKGWRATTAA